MPKTIDNSTAAAEYDRDFFLWTQQQAETLRRVARDRTNAPVDWENVAEEIESLGKSDRRRVQSLSYNILTHLLKLRTLHKSDARSHWKAEIRNWRLQLERVLEDSPSLRQSLHDLAKGEWNAAVRQVEQDLQDNGEDAGDLRALVYFEFLHPDSSRLLDPDFFPEPLEQE